MSEAFNCTAADELRTKLAETQAAIEQMKTYVRAYHEYDPAWDGNGPPQMARTGFAVQDSAFGVRGMSRTEFSKATKRLAWDRSGGICEATGSWWGLPDGMRCTNRVAEYDHIILDANSHDNSLANCAAVCSPCHRFKTTTRDTPTAAKTLRQQDKNRGIRGPKFRWWKAAKSVRREA